MERLAENDVGPLAERAKRMRAQGKAPPRQAEVRMPGGAVGMKRVAGTDRKDVP